MEWDVDMGWELETGSRRGSLMLEVDMGGRYGR